MTITFKQLEKKIKSLTGLLFTMPENQRDVATEIWIKFRNEGRYICINFESPLPQKIEFHKLVGSGDALNVSENKRNNSIMQYLFTSEVKEILNNSLNYGNNIDETVISVVGIFDVFNDRTIHR